jgi:hypothetical protein
MRKTLWIVPVLSLVAAIGVPTVVKASDITYTVDESVGAFGSVTGLILTDGKLGTLATSDILNWVLTVNDGTITSDGLGGPSSGNNSQVLVLGSDLTASATQLLFNFSGSDEGGLLFEGAILGDNGPFVCYVATSGCGESGGVSLAAEIGEADTVDTALSGTHVIATVGTAATTPEPRSVILMLIGLVSLMMVSRKRMTRGQQAPQVFDLPR